MRNKFFEGIFRDSDWKPIPLEVASKIPSKNVYFMYRSDRIALHAGLFVYSDNKEDIERFVKDLVKKAKIVQDKSILNEFLVGKLVTKTKEILIFVDINDIYRVDFKGKIKLINDIETVLFLRPEDDIYTYNLPIRIVEIGDKA